MGTRALTHIKSEGKLSDTLVTIYRQMDGYPACHGEELKQCITRPIGNGLSQSHYNGMEEMAPHLIIGLKSLNLDGNIYIHKPDIDDVGEEYTYYLYQEGEDVCVQICHGDDLVYDGLLRELDVVKLQEKIDEQD